jgi:hypothetical protein
MFLFSRSNVAPIRRQVDQVYRNLHQMCDVLEGQMDKSTETNPHELRVEESYELITGLKKLFNESSPAEQVRLMTIAPKNWGRSKTERWCVNRAHLNGSSIGLFSVFSTRFQSTERHARQAAQLRDNNQVLAFPQYLRGNASISEETITTVIEFYQEDSISRISANSKDVIQIKKKPVAVRFMEMTVLDAFREFDRRYPDLIRRSTFHSLRPRNVKIVAPHETCMCIYHENMHLLLQVSKFTIVRLLNILKFFCRHGTKTINGYRSNLLHQHLRNSL